MNNDYGVLNTAVMKVTGPHSSFSWTKTSLKARQARLLGKQAGTDSGRQHLDTDPPSAAPNAEDLPPCLRCLHTTLSIVLENNSQSFSFDCASSNNNHSIFSRPRTVLA